MLAELQRSVDHQIWSCVSVILVSCLVPVGRFIGRSSSVRAVTGAKVWQRVMLLLRRFAGVNSLDQGTSNRAARGPPWTSTATNGLGRTQPTAPELNVARSARFP